MASYCNSYKGLADIAVADLVENDLNAVGKRIREVGDGESDLTSDYPELRSTRRRVIVDPSPSVSLLGGSSNSNEEENSDSDLSPLLSTNKLADELEDKDAVSDAEGQLESVQAETTTLYGGGGERSHIGIAEGSDSVVSAEVRRSTEPNPRGGPVIYQTPLEAEIDEFLTAAEKNLQKCFSDKYNFDTKNGVPMEGRFEWVPVHHEWP